MNPMPYIVCNPETPEFVEQHIMDNGVKGFLKVQVHHINLTLIVQILVVEKHYKLL